MDKGKEQPEAEETDTVSRRPKEDRSRTTSEMGEGQSTEELTTV
jgi:hypothetical protein